MWQIVTECECDLATHSTCECHLATVQLGLAARFAVLATNIVTDPMMDSTINGDMGTSTGTTLPAYGPYTSGTGLNGTSHPSDAIAINARAAAAAALVDILSRSTCVTALGGVAELGGLTLKPGIYTSTSSLQGECIYICSTSIPNSSMQLVGLWI